MNLTSLHKDLFSLSKSSFEEYIEFYCLKISLLFFSIFLFFNASAQAPTGGIFITNGSVITGQEQLFVSAAHRQKTFASSGIVYIKAGAFVSDQKLFTNAFIEIETVEVIAQSMPRVVRKKSIQNHLAKSSTPTQVLPIPLKKAPSGGFFNRLNAAVSVPTTNPRSNKNRVAKVVLWSALLFVSAQKQKGTVGYTTPISSLTQQGAHKAYYARPPNSQG